MSKEIAGIARNSCPLCGELTRVPGDEFFSGGMTKFFRCSACKGQIRVASSTRVAAGFGGLLGLAPGLYALNQLSPALLLIAVFAGYALAATVLWRLTMRLEPANL